MEKPKEKTPEQMFGEKFSHQENTAESIPNVKKEPFPWVQKSPAIDVISYKQLDELAALGSKNKVTTPATPYELPNPHYSKPTSFTTKNEDSQSSNEKDVSSKNTHLLTSDEIVQYQQMINSLLAEIEQYKSKIGAMQPEIAQYQNIINSLRAELAQYRNEKPQATSSEIIQYQQLINSLRGEIQEYKYKIEAMQPEIAQYDKIINSLKADLARQRNEKPPATSSEFIQYQQLINSLRTELSEYKNKVELLSVERNQQSNIDLLRAELAQNRNERPQITSNEFMQCQQLINSLRTELSEYKNKVELLSVERNQQSNIDLLRAELAEYKNKVELLSVERNQQSNIDLLRAELAEYKNKFSSTPFPSAQNENVMRSLDTEISRLKNNLDSLILK